ncbi:AI-2E family transporter [Zeaxanthinibacter enoshimensis]|uniref:Putative PurR-regulated permease PerM n=1 Tax=Zeaxanthinibacter enoshimensis TaxID=392009 RepID=A0A4R6TKX4_9FLAO|nr:AI-2E family transporter [Zeaxanthinibacter enoshimensis]TDQ31132.1 putative PurR-regulated permease PerM [Zeaxanthinibacter enoshimensis]
MTYNDITKGIVQAVAIVAGVYLLFHFLYLVSAVIAYVAIAVVLALIGRPVVLTLRRKLRFPNTIAVAVTMLLMLLMIGGLIALFVPLITEQGKNLSLLNIEDLQESLDAIYREFTFLFGATPETVNELIKDSKLENNVLQGLNVEFIPNILNSFLDILSSFSIGLFSVLFITFFFLKDSKLFQNAILVFVPDGSKTKVVKSIDSIKALLSRYFVGLLLQLFILFAIYTVVLLLVGIENAIVIAFLCALFNIIPYVGPIIGGIIMVFLTMTSNLGYDFNTVILPKTGYVLIGLTIGQLIDNFFSQPFIFSNSVKSHPLEIFLVIIIAGIIFGVVGMIVAVPGYTMLKVILKEFMADNHIVKKLTHNL